MSKTKKTTLIKESLYITLVIMLGVLAIVFAVLYIDTFNSGFFNDYRSVITSVSVAIITVITVLSITFFRSQKKFIYKLFFVSITLITITIVFLYLLKYYGFLDKIDSVEDFREYIDSFGNFAVVLFIILQLLQVVVLPIPSFITVGAGVLLFGAFKGAIFSIIGIVIGSLIAFLIGRIFGFKVAKWMVGESNLNKGLKAIKGKDKIVLTFMFLFPFFPDDVLCFVAGITTISPAFFTIMIIVTRVVTIFASSYSINNSIIPYNTWWGILLWALFFVFTIVLTILIYKYGEKIERFFTKFKKSK